MALDYSPLLAIDPGGAFLRGRERAIARGEREEAQADRNLLRQAQMEQMEAQRENMLAQRQEREAHAEERRLGAARRQEEDAWLGKMADLFGQNNMPLTPETVQQGLAFALRSRNPAAIQMMQKTVEAMQARQQQIEEDARAEAELARITGRSTRAAPSVVRQPAAAMPTAPAAPANLLAGTPYDIGVGAPAPTNALAAPPAPQPAPTGGFTREQVQQMLTSPSARIREQGKALASTLEKPQTYTPSADMQGYELAKSEGFKGTFFDYKRQLAEAGRPPAQPKEPPAPTITQIQDPSDPMRMITIDARRYTGGSVGAPGVIGASGKTVKAEADALKKEQAQSDASAILDTLKVAYSNLDRLRAIPSEQRGVLSNLTSGVAATGVGQVAGRMVGTEAQTQRDIIASARNQLFAAVKNATGLSAQNLNSNVEFTTWLNSLTDPSRSIESNRVILDNMERFIASGGKHSARTAEGKVKPSGAPAAPNIDALLNKYK